MANGKKSVVIYSDWEEYFSDLEDHEAGKLIKHFFAFINDRDPVLEDRLLLTAFKPIRMQLERDLNKWRETREKRSKAGKIGGLRSGAVRQQTETNEANASFVKQNEANEAVNVIMCNNVLDVNDICNTDNNILGVEAKKASPVKKTKSTIEERKKIFYNRVAEYVDTYSREMLKSFYEYWTEHGDDDHKMRFEKEKSFGTSQRLSTWNKNDLKFKTNDTKKPAKKQLSIAEQMERVRQDAIARSNMQ